VGSGPVGIDVEYMRAYDSGIAERFFHPGEYARACRFAEERRKERFYDLWTIKESYIKALGKGLSLALDSFENPACKRQDRHESRRRASGDEIQTIRPGFRIQMLRFALRRSIFRSGLMV